MNGTLDSAVYMNRSDVPRAHGQVSQNVLKRIKSSKVLRVGYVSDRFTFSFFNQNGTLVGYDIQIAYNLAHFLGVSLVEFVPVTYV